ncbi:MAG: hypothetical protein ACYCOU_25835 [Sulfobacillus sp.]
MIRYDKATRTFRDSSGRFVSKSRGLKSSLARKQYKQALPKAGRRPATKRAPRATSSRRRVSAPIARQAVDYGSLYDQLFTQTYAPTSAPSVDYGRLYDELFNQAFAPQTEPAFTIRRIRREEDFEAEGDIDGAYYDSSYSIEDEFEYVSWDELFEQFDEDFDEEVEDSP